MIRFYTHKKHKKNTRHQKYQKHKNTTKQKYKNANKRTKIKNALKKHLSGKKSLIRLFARKSLCSRNVGFTKLVFCSIPTKTSLLKPS